MEETKGVIYILTNPSFPDYVKIGYADDIEKRLNQLNRSECTPFAFRVYAYYEVNHRLTDMKIHDVIDRLNPNLRSIDNVNGKKRVREFYAMSKEEAYELFEAIAEINGLEGNLHLVAPTDKEKNEEETAKTIRPATDFNTLGLKAGDKLVFIKDAKISCEVLNSKKVLYKDEEWAISALATELLTKNYNYSGHGVNGYQYFTFNGETLWNRRLRMESEN